MRKFLTVLLFLVISGVASAEPADDLTAKGMEALRAMDFGAAMASFSAALDANPKHVPAAYQRGRIFLKMGEHKNAISDFTTVIVNGQGSGLALVRRGEAYMALNNPQSAFADFDAAVANSPELSEVFVVRATYRFKIGNLAGARSDMEAALKVASGSDKPRLQKMLDRMKRVP